MSPEDVGPGHPADRHVTGRRQPDPGLVRGNSSFPTGSSYGASPSPDLTCTRTSPANPNTDEDKITAAASFWHANTIRIQVAWQHLFVGSGNTVDQSYLSQLDSEVALARSLHLVVDHHTADRAIRRVDHARLPRRQFLGGDCPALRFDPDVVFDLFNEPRLNANHWPGWSESGMWDIWQNGGSVTLAGDSTPTTFVGMQQLVGYDPRCRRIQCHRGGRESGRSRPLRTSEAHVDGSEHHLWDRAGPGPRSTFPYADDTLRLWTTNWGTLSATYPW